MFDLSVQDVAQILTVIVAILALWFPNRDYISLEAFFTNSASLPIPNQNPPINIHTHAVVLRNTGSVSANNVIVTHQSWDPLLSWIIHPIVDYEVVQLKVGFEIIFKKIRPKEQLTITYLYPNSIYWHNIGLAVKHDNGFATIYNADFTKPLKAPTRYFFLTIFFIGLTVSTYYLGTILLPFIFKGVAS